MPRTRPNRTYLSLLIAVMLGITAACTFLGPVRQPREKEKFAKCAGDTGLSQAEAYAGEIMSYLLRVVLGQAGRPDSRNAWATTGVDCELTLENIYEIMSGPDRNMQEIMVLDSNILDLSRVLYYYDERLSLSKGKPSFMSIYPAPEFLAIRCLLVRKIQRSEKISLQSLVEREGRLLSNEYKPSVADIRATNLKTDEWNLIRDIISNEPHLYDYLKSPFLVKALEETGAAKKDAFVERKIAKANYKACPCRLLNGADGRNAVKIFLLPSMTKEFHYGRKGFSESGFKPTVFLSEMINRFRNEILSRTRSRIAEKLGAVNVEITMEDDKRLAEPVEKILREKISFYVEDERPLVIYPENADEVIRDICPSADFSVILLGKNVYLALHIDEGKDVYPSVNRMYIDILDIKHSQVDYEYDKISEFICARLKKDIEDLASLGAMR